MGHANMITFHFPIETRILRTAVHTVPKSKCLPRKYLPYNQLFVDKRTFFVMSVKNRIFGQKSDPWYSVL